MEGLTLAVRLEQDETELRATYTVANDRRGEPIYLLNQLQTEDAFSTEIAYTCWVEGETALLLQGETPEPEDPLVQRFKPEVPGATRLLPGESFSATVRAGLPLQEWNAYQDPDPDVPFDAVRIDRIVLRIQYIVESATFYTDEYENFPGVYQVNGNPVLSLGVAAELHSPTVLHRRRDAFLRFS